MAAQKFRLYINKNYIEVPPPAPYSSSTLHLLLIPLSSPPSLYPPLTPPLPSTHYLLLLLPTNIKDIVTNHSYSACILCMMNTNVIPIFGLDSLLGASTARASTRPYLSALFKRSSLPFTVTTCIRL